MRKIRPFKNIVSNFCLTRRCYKQHTSYYTNFHNSMIASTLGLTLHDFIFNFIKKIPHTSLAIILIYLYTHDFSHLTR